MCTTSIHASISTDTSAHRRRRAVCKTLAIPRSFLCRNVHGLVGFGVHMQAHAASRHALMHAQKLRGYCPRARTCSAATIEENHAHSVTPYHAHSIRQHWVLMRLRHKIPNIKVLACMLTFVLTCSALSIQLLHGWCVTYWYKRWHVVTPAVLAQRMCKLRYYILSYFLLCTCTTVYFYCRLPAITAAATATIAAVQAESPSLTSRDLSTDNDDDLRLGASCSTTPLLRLLSDADTPLFALFLCELPWSVL
jgi:hypothetical protein